MSLKDQDYPIEVSILITVYNHEKYLHQCLDSIVSQKTSFRFEIVIGEDCSPDKSREIVVEYANRYPRLIIPILYEVNQGTKDCPGKGNFVNTFYQCRGKYIVHIEADDFLIDDTKLQKQYDFLEANPDSTACFHNAIMKFEDESDNVDRLINPPDQKDKIFPEDLLGEKEVWFMATASVMFRRGCIGEKFSEWFLQTKSGDIPLYLILSNQGYIGYISDVMSVYRRHKAGLSYTDSNFDEKFIKNRILMYSNVDEALEYKHSRLIKRILGQYDLILANIYKLNNNPLKSFLFALKSINRTSPNSVEHIKQVTQDFIIPSFGMRIYANLKGFLQSLL